MRPIVLSLAREPHVRGFLTRGPGRVLANRYVAGETLEAALGEVRDLVARGARVSLNYLGEAIETFDEAEHAAEVYEATVDRVRGLGTSVTLSLKPSQFGVDLARDRCLDLLARVVGYAGSRGIGVRLDMEDSTHTDPTLWLWRELGRRGTPVGVVLQAALYRTPRDLESVIEAHGSVRLCKGAYLEPPMIAYPRKSEVDAAYARLMERLLGYASVSNPVGPGRLPLAGLATHDERLIHQAIGSIHDLDLDPSLYEFQMLHGVRRDLQDHLLAQGYPLRVYTPWGPAWYPYLARRLAERPANLVFMAASIFREATGRRPRVRAREHASSRRSSSAASRVHDS